jgi:MFS family permease
VTAVGTEEPHRPRLLTGDFVAVTVASLFFFLGAGVVIPVLPHFVTHGLGGGSLSVGVVVGAFSFSAVLTRPTAGRVGNRLGRRILMVAGALVAGASIACYGAAPSVATLAALRLITGFGEGLFFTGSATLVADLAVPERRGEALSYFSVAVYLGIGLGPAIGQSVAQAAGAPTAFVVAGSISGFGALISTRVPHGRLPTAEAAARLPLVHRKAIGPGAVLALGLMGFTAFQAYVPLYADQLHLGGSQYVFLVYAGVVLVVRVVGARVPDALGPTRTGTLATLSIAAGLAIIAASSARAGLYGGTVVFAVGMALQYPALMTLAVNRAAPAERSAVVGTFTAFFDLAQGAGGFILGGVAAAGGYQASFAGGAVFALLGLTLLRARVAPPAGRHDDERRESVRGDPEAWMPPGAD